MTTLQKNLSLFFRRSHTIDKSILLELREGSYSLKIPKRAIKTSRLWELYFSTTVGWRKKFLSLSSSETVVFPTDCARVCMCLYVCLLRVYAGLSHMCERDGKKQRVR